MKTKLLMLCLLFQTVHIAQTPTGELKRWHKISIDFDGPSTSETATTNPFSDFKLDVTFFHAASNTTMVVAGFYSGCADPSENSCDAGAIWKVNFTPSYTGTWNWTVSFTSGIDVAIAGGGVSGAFMDGDSGSFQIAESDKSGRDHRGATKGKAIYVGEHYLQYSGSDPASPNGDWFVKAGADAPENTLAYDDFDATPNRGNLRKNWNPHQQDYVASDASDYTWNGGKGSELLGVINYLSNKGLNAFSFLTLSIHGDDENVFPHLLKVSDAVYNSYNDSLQWNQGVYKDRFDVSKLAQWERIFEYADKKGLFMHFKTMETENDSIMDNNSFGRERQLYYRELIARFGHHLALNWNISEESILSNSVAIATSNYIKALDPYDNLIVLHTYPNQQNQRYTPLLGNNSSLSGASIQTEKNQVHDMVKTWVDNSRNAGKKWVVANDEQGNANIGVDQDPNDDKLVRHNVLWGALMAGGAGVEYYYGYETGETDLTAQDHRSRDTKYTHASYALNFFNSHLQDDLVDMISDDEVTSETDDYVFAKPNAIYVVYRPNGGSTNLTLPSGNWTVSWYNPRTGGNLSNESPVTDTLTAPDTEDWVAYIKGAQLPFTMNAIVDQQATVGDTVSLLANATGGDLSQPIMFSISGQPLGLEIDVATGEISGIINSAALTGGTNNDGIHQVTVTSDRQGSTSVQEQFIWTVTNILSGGVESITLIDADTDQDLFTITDNMQIDFALISGIGLNIRGNSNSTGVGSVDFEIIGAFNHIETDNIAAYSLFGDDNFGDYTGQFLPVGDYVLTANAYSGEDKTGSVYTSYSIRFSIVAEESCEWFDLESAQVSRFESRSERVGDNVYVFGGFMAGIELSTTTEIYNLTTDDWTSAAEILVPASHAGTMAVGTDIWLIGGFDEAGEAKVTTDVVQVYDTASDSWSYGPSLPQPIASGEAAIHDNKIYFFGGVLNDQQTDSGNHYVLDLNDIQSGWTIAAPLPTPRNHHSATTLNGIIYAIGGQIGHTTAMGDVNVVEAYNPETNVWTRVANLPTNRSHFEPGTTIHNNKIMIVGGKMATGSYSDAITEYDPLLDVWTDKECKLPEKLFAPVAHVYNNKLTVSGGGVNGTSNITNATRWLQLNTDLSTAITVQQFANQLNQPNQDVGVLSIIATGGDPSLAFSYSIIGQPSGLSIDSESGEIFGIVDALALSNGPNLDGLHFVTVTVSKVGFEDEQLNFTWYITNQIWQVKGEVESYSKRHECSFVEIGDKFALIGGRESSDVDVFDYNLGVWNPAVSTSPSILNHFQGVYYQGYVWAIGAIVGGNSAFPNDPIADHIWLFDTTTNLWIQGPEIPEARKRGSSGLVMYNNKFYLIGGNTLGHSGGFVPWFDEFDPKSGIWTTLTDAPNARDHFQATLVGDKIYMIGGAQTSQPISNFVAEVDVYDFNAGTWSTLFNKDLPTPRDGASIAVFNDDIIVMGGGDKDLTINGVFVKGTREITEAFDIETETWFKMPDMNFGHRSTQAIVSGNGIHILGGQSSAGPIIANMEYYGDDSPTGSPILASQFSVPNLVTVPSESNSAFIIEVLNGGTGIFITSMEIIGTDASDFSISSGEITNGLLSSGSSHTLNIALSGSGDNRTASLVINYGNSQTAVVNLTNSPLASPRDQSSFIGDIVSLQIEAIDNGDAYSFTASDLPEGLAIDESTGLISGAVTGAILNSPYTSRVAIINILTSLEVSFVNFQWEVIDPTIITLEAIPEQSNFTGDTVLFSASATGGDEAFPMVYIISEAPLGVSIDGATGEITGNIDLSAGLGGPNSDGVYLVNVTASRQGTFDVMTNFTWTITDVPLALFRINAGGPELTYNSEIFSTDANFIGGKTFENTSATVSPLFQTERSADPPTFEYAFSVPSGDYEVVLYFAEIFYGAAGGGSGGIGERVFDVEGEGVKLLDDYDIYADVGAQTEVSKTFMVSVSDGELNLLFDAEGSDGADQPKVSAIEIFGLIQYPAISVDVIVDQNNVVGDDSSTLAVAASGGNPSANFTYAISGEPDGIFIEPTNGLIYGTISMAAVIGGADENGVHQVVVTVSKLGSAPVDINFNWIITGPPLPFTINAIVDQQDTVGVTVSLQANATGGDISQPITFSISGQPLGLDIDTATGEITGIIDLSAGLGGPNSDGVYLVTVAASRQGASDVQTQFSWTVIEEATDLPWTEDFEDLVDGAILDTGVTAWSTSIDQGVWDVRGGLLLLSSVNGGSTAVWSSERIAITGHENVTISIDVNDLDDTKESNDYVNVYYKLDDGSLIPFGTVTGDIDLTTFTVSGITGSVLELVVETQVSFSGETYSIDNVNVSGTPTNPIAVSSVTISPSTLTVEMGDSSQQLTATVNPFNADDTSVFWLSSDDSIATVNQNGFVTPIAIGNATITVTTTDGGFEAESIVTIIEAVIPATGITLSSANATMRIGDAPLQLEATILPSNADNQGVLWSTSDSSVVSVNSSGQVIANTVGTAVITVTTTDGGFEAESIITVIEAIIPATGITLSPANATMRIGDDPLQLEATILPSNADNQGVLWSTSDSSVVSVNSSGQVVANSVGTAVITVTTTDGGFEAESIVTVIEAVIPVTGITLSPSNATMRIGGGVLLLEATISPSNAGNQSVLWSTSDSSVVSVNSSGQAIANSVGTAVITVTSTDGGFEAESIVTVTEAVIPVTGITLSPADATMRIGGGVLQLEATILPSNADNQGVLWSTSNSSVVSVNSSGQVIANTVGTAVITVTTNDGGFEAASIVTVTEAVIPVTGITLNPANATMRIGDDPLQLEATILPSNADNQGVLWSTSNSSVVSVNSSGQVIANTVGTAVITVTTTDGGFEAESIVTVIEAIIPVTGITLSPANATMRIGDDPLQLEATILPSNADNQGVLWSTSDGSVVSVNSSGQAIANSVGTAVITVTTTDGGFEAESIVTIIEAVIPVTGITLSPANATMRIGDDPLQLEATILPSNADNQGVLWSTSDGSVVSVNSSGQVIANTVGTAVITVTTTDGGFEAESIVTVIEAIIPVTGITLSPANATMRIGDDPLQLEATILPSNADNQGVLWSTNNSSVVSVNSSGQAIANTVGTAVITVTSTDGGFVSTATINVVEAVTDLPWFEDFEDLADGSILDTGVTAWSTSIDQGALDVRGGLLLLSSVNGGSTAVWSSERISITGYENVTISIDVDDLDATKESNDYVKVYYKLDDGSLIPFGTVTGNIDLTTFTVSGITGSVLELVVETQVSWSGETYSIDNVNVSGTPTNPIAVSSVTISPSTLTVEMGDSSQQITATVNPFNANDTSVFWLSSDDSIVTVDQSGFVTPIAIGNASITVTTTDGGFEAASIVTVIEAVIIPVTGITLSPSNATMRIGDDPLQLEATILPSNAGNQGVSWSTSNSSVVSVNSSGQAIANTVGTAVITVTTTDGGFEAESIVTVIEAVIPVTGITLSPADATMRIGDDPLQLEATILPSNADNQGVLWSTSDSSVVSVNSSGQVIANTVGTAVITVTTTDGGFEAESIVTVIEALIPVTGITLSPANATMRIGGGTLQLEATILPSNADNQSVLWSTSNSSVVTVNSSGQAIANTLGTAVITVTTTDGGFVSTATINVVEAVTDLPWFEDFEDLADGSTLDTGVTAWSTSIDQGAWDVRGGLLLLSSVNGGSTGVWSSERISITGYENVTISIDVDDLDATKESNDYVKVYYKLDDGPLIPFGTVTGNIDLTTFTVSGITGSILELVAETKVSWSGEIYSIDNVNVSGVLGQQAFKTSISSFEDIPKDAYIIYPNPVSGILNIRTSEINIIDFIQIFDVAGKLVRNYDKSTFNTAATNIHITLDGLQTGAYSVHIIDSHNNRFVKKLLVN